MKTRYPSTISRRVALFFAVSIFVSGIIFAVVQFVLSLHQMEKLETESLSSLKDLSEINYQLQVNAIFPFAVELLNTLVDKSSIQICEKLRENPGKIIEDIPGLYEIATKPIMLGDALVGYFTLVDASGKIIFSYYKDKYQGKNAIDFEKGELVTSNKVESIFSQNRYMESFSRIIAGNRFKKNYFLVSKKIQDSDYFLLGFVNLVKSINPIYENYTEQEAKIISSLDRNIESEFNRTWIIAFSIFLGVIIFLSAIFAFVGLFLAKLVTKPIVELRDGVAAISNGDFDAKVKESGTVETIHLARNFNQLGEKLKKYIQNLKEETARHASVKSELKIARTIQKSLLPKLTNDFKREEFVLSTFFQPAKEVSGDFYDFFYIDEAKENLVLVLGDISGKGVPAALFMAVIKTTIRNFCQNFNLLSPGKLLSKVNTEICSNNSEDMFATIFLSYYEMKTGILSFANAGHHDSILIKASDKKLTQFGANDESLVGAFAEIEYKTSMLQLQRGDSIICYTDGVTDSTSPDGQIFGEDKLIGIVQDNLDKLGSEVIGIISSEVVEFQKNNLFDDITLLSLQRKG
ncbi:MAG: PP2C family protein-serine/threonine phosphatase [Lentisphaerota bacterium]